MTAKYCTKASISSILNLKSAKAISLWQPWGELIIKTNPKTGQPFKQYETRSWATDYRGKLIIQTALKKNLDLCIQSDSIAEKLGIEIDFPKLPRGMAIAVADLTDCIYMSRRFISEQSQEEIICGNWDINRYAWKLENVQTINPPIPLKGKQGLWNVDISQWFKQLKPTQTLEMLGFSSSPYTAEEERQANKLVESYKGWDIFFNIPNGGICACILISGDKVYDFPVGDTDDDWEVRFVVTESVA